MGVIVELFVAWRTVEWDEHGAEAIKRREQRRKQTDDIKCWVIIECAGQDGIFGKETGQERDASQRRRTNQEGAESAWHFILQAAHFADVQLAMQAMHYATSGQEQECLEKRMCHQMKDRSHISAHTHA